MRLCDIGPGTVQDFSAALRRARLVLWNGPLGAYEDPRHGAGTRAFVGALIGRETHVVCGGGDTLAFCAAAGLTDRMGYCSTGGGALLRYFQGQPMPGLEVLRADRGDAGAIVPAVTHDVTARS